jgi:DNA recombination-mediator protein A
MDDASPPPCLKEIYDSPLITRVRGNPEVLTKPGIAMVGTRHPTPTVLAWPSGWPAIWRPRDWSLLILVMSGLARGVETASHRRAISAKGKTVAVFGTGVDVIYLSEDSPLSEQILALGSALISEFSLEHLPLRRTFPSVTGSSAECRWAYWPSKPRNIRHAHHRRLCARTKSRTGLRCRQRHQQKFLETEPPHPTGRRAGGDRGRRMRRTSNRTMN